jgi:hypothetical protein
MTVTLFVLHACIILWQLRTRRWSRHTDNVAGSSDVSPRTKLRVSRTIPTVRTRHETRLVKISSNVACRVRGFLCFQCGNRDSAVCSVNPTRNY